MSWNKHFSIVTIAMTIAVLSAPALAHAQSAVRIEVTPRQTEVYVDGYVAGIVDDFDGIAQRLRVAPGEHEIELYLEGHKTIAQTIAFVPGQSYRIRHTMEPLAAGEAAPAKPTPKPGAAAPSPRGHFDAFGQPSGRGVAAGGGPARVANESSTLAIRVQPGDATILVDGERWQSSGNDRLEIQVTPGEHRIEIQKDGYQPFTSTVRVRPGESNAINVSLTKSGDESTEQSETLGTPGTYGSSGTVITPSSEISMSLSESEANLLRSRRNAIGV